jgi:hypothetical protein
MGPGGFRRRGRRRGLIIGAAAGATIANRSKRNSEHNEPEPSNYEAELQELASLKAKSLISDEEYDAKRKQILGL